MFVNFRLPGLSRRGHETGQNAMFADTDYQNLASTLVGIYGCQAVDYARRNAAALCDGNAKSEQALAWDRIAGMIERLIIARRKSRRKNDASPAN